MSEHRNIKTSEFCVRTELQRSARGGPGPTARECMTEHQNTYVDKETRAQGLEVPVQIETGTGSNSTALDRQWAVLQLPCDHRRCEDPLP